MKKDCLCLATVALGQAVQELCNAQKQIPAVSACHQAELEGDGQRAGAAADLVKSDLTCK